MDSVRGFSHESIPAKDRSTSAQVPANLIPNALKKKNAHKSKTCKPHTNNHTLFHTKTCLLSMTPLERYTPFKRWVDRRVFRHCRNPGLNQGPLDLQSNALPTELFRPTS